ncbi:hypothetical protein BDZ89DRAFT_1078899 [Hymenopellis radicata]|nr:hypothetical protein BDZ89DRAFT_1078899 [Hymenopellis radicata]
MSGQSRCLALTPHMPRRHEGYWTKICATLLGELWGAPLQVVVPAFRGDLRSIMRLKGYQNEAEYDI